MQKCLRSNKCLGPKSRARARGGGSKSTKYGLNQRKSITRGNFVWLELCGLCLYQECNNPFQKKAGRTKTQQKKNIGKRERENTVQQCPANFSYSRSGGTQGKKKMLLKKAPSGRVVPPAPATPSRGAGGPGGSYNPRTAPPGGRRRPPRSPGPPVGDCGCTSARKHALARPLSPNCHMGIRRAPFQGLHRFPAPTGCYLVGSACQPLTPWSSKKNGIFHIVGCSNFWIFKFSEFPNSKFWPRLTGGRCA